MGFLSLCPFVVLSVLLSTVTAYEASEDKEDIFDMRACPAFLVFDNAAYLSDMTIELPCHCKPEEAHSVVWYYQKQLGSGDIRALTDFEGTSVLDSSHAAASGSELRSRFSIRLFSLVVFRAQQSDSGHYICGTASGQFFYGYDVDVQEATRISFPWTKKRRGPAVRSGGKVLFQVFMSFWSWTVCDRCGVRGEQTGVGLCYVQSDYLKARYRLGVDGITSCGSSAVPDTLGLEKESYGAELRVRSCTVPCPLKPPIVSEHQALLEFIGYGETDEKATIPIYYHNHPVDTSLILSCPGARPEHAVAWDRGAVPLYRTQYLEGQNQSARIFIDTGHHLHFQPVRQEDGGTYYCWLQGKYAAEIRLLVYVQLGHKRTVSDPESIYAMKIVLICYAVFTAVFFLMVFGQHFWRTLKIRRVAR